MFFTFSYVLQLTLISLAIFQQSSFSIILNSKPKLILKNPSSKDVEKIKDNQFFIKTFRLVELECIADYPIEITASGFMFNWIDYTEREVIKKSSPHNDDYRIAIGFKSNPEATGLYTCSYVSNNSTGDKNDPHLVSSLYIFADDRNKSEKILTYNKVSTKIVTLATDTEILIPCVTYSPYLILDLYKNVNSSFQQHFLVPESAYNFEPSQGFFVKVTQNNNYLANYMCKSKDDSVTYLVQIPDFRVNIAESEIRLSPREIVFFKCESIHPTKIFFRKVEERGFSGREGRPFSNPSSYYKHIATINITAPEKVPWKGYVECVYRNGPNKKPYHTWNVSIVSQGSMQSRSEPSVSVNIGFHKGRNSFYCSVSKELSPTMTAIDCNNLVNCETSKNFDHHSYKLMLPFNVSKGALAARYFKQELKLEQDNECAIITAIQNSTLGVIQCFVVEKVLQGMPQPFVILLEYFIDLNNQIVKEIDQNDVPLKDVLRFNDLNESVYFGQTIDITCQASTIVFAKGMKMNMRIMQNKKQLNDVSAPLNSFHSSDNHKITLTQTFRIWSMEIVSIECNALHWKTNIWKHISKKVLVKEGQSPKIIDLEMNSKKTPVTRKISIEIKMHGEKNISCSATGIPLPTIQWARHDDLTNSEIISKTKNLQEFKSYVNNTITSTLSFKKITQIHECEYICIAVNVIGQENRTFHVIVKSDAENYRKIFYIIGGVCAGIILIFLLVVIFLCRTLKSQQNEIEKLSEVEILHFMNGNQDLVQRYEELNDVAQYLPYKQQYEIPPPKIEFKNDVLGSGDYGIVLRGVLEKSGTKSTVAVKTVKSGTDIRHLKSLLSEIKIMMYIGKHPHIIELLGAMTKELKDGKLHVIVEFCSNGNLQNYLRLCRPVFVNQIVNDEIKTNPAPTIPQKPPRRFLGIEDAITTAIEKRRSRNSNTIPIVKTKNLVTWCYEVATGMEYLASKKVVHGDLATRNLLITEDLSVKITDFGLSRHLYAYTDYVKKQQTEPLPWRWLSIEGIQDSKFSTESDVWAYGITLWEIFTLGETPYQGFCWGEEFVQDLCKGYRMGKPKYANNELHNTMLECWNAAPKDRPTFTDIANNFREMLQRISYSPQQNVAMIPPATSSKDNNMLLRVPVEA